MSKTQQLKQWQETEERLFKLRSNGSDPHAEQIRNNRKWDNINRNRRITATSLK